VLERARVDGLWSDVYGSFGLRSTGFGVWVH
jgi:hypothetical protein